MSNHAAPRPFRFTLAAIAAGVAGTVAVALSVSGSLSGFVATITNSTNTAAVAALAVAETSGANTCNSYDATATCSTINKYGGTTTPLVPGGSQTVTVTFTNTGNVAVASGALTPGACVATSTGAVGGTTPTTPNTDPGNLCSVLTIKVYAAATATGTPIYTGTAAGFTAAVALGALAKAANQPYTFVTSLPAAATTAVQGQQVSQPLVWTFNA
jgi:hypothetical protein